MLLNALLQVLISVAQWFVSLFPSGTANVSSLQGAFSDMGFLRLVVPFGTLSEVVGVAVGIVAVVYIVQAVIWAWKLVKW